MARGQLPEVKRWLATRFHIHQMGNEQACKEKLEVVFKHLKGLVKLVIFPFLPYKPKEVLAGIARSYHSEASFHLILNGIGPNFWSSWVISHHSWYLFLFPLFSIREGIQKKKKLIVKIFHLIFYLSLLEHDCQNSVQSWPKCACRAFQQSD